MGILVPVALVAAGLWGVIAAACATVGCLVLVTSLAFGTGIWSAWIAHIYQYSDQFAAESGAIAHLMPTVSAALIRLGAAPAAAHAGQFVAALIAAAIVWRCFRVEPTPLAAAALFVATFLASPHAFVYDMPLLATAVLWTIAGRQYAGDAFGTVEMVILLLALVSPMALVSGASAVPVVQLTLTLLLVVIACQCERQRRGDISVVAFGSARREV